MAVEIPTKDERSDAIAWEQRVTLEGATYRLAFHYNAQLDAYFLDLATEDGTAIVSGRRIVVDTPLLAEFHHLTSCPPGELIAFDKTLRQVDPGLDELGERVVLLYYEAAEVSAAVAGAGE